MRECEDTPRFVAAVDEPAVAGRLFATALLAAGDDGDDEEAAALLGFNADLGVRGDEGLAAPLGLDFSMP